MRSGTENVMGISAFGAAAQYMSENRVQIQATMRELYDYAAERLSALDVQINRPAGARVDHIINITLPDIKSETMLHHLSAKGIFVSSGSACSSHSSKPSGSLIAFGLTPHMADCSLRVSMSPFNTKEHIDALCDGLENGIDTLVRIRR